MEPEQPPVFKVRLARKAKSLSLVIVGAYAYSKSCAPAIAGITPAYIDYRSLLNGIRMPSASEATIDLAIASLGVYATLLLQGPAIRAVSRALGEGHLGQRKKTLEELADRIDSRWQNSRVLGAPMRWAYSGIEWYRNRRQANH